MPKKQDGWVIARVPSNKEFKFHDMVSRPVIGYGYDDKGEQYSKHGTGPHCYTPVEVKLVAKNQWTRIKSERRTHRPWPMLRGYVFVQEPEPRLIADLRERGLCYGLIPDVPTRQNDYVPGPLRLSNRAINHMRARYQCEYDPVTGAGHQTTVDPKALMRPGYEYGEGDYVLADDPAWIGHKMLCVEVMDTTARFICQMFGIDHPVELPLGDLRKAG